MGLSAAVLLLLFSALVPLLNLLSGLSRHPRIETETLEVYLERSGQKPNPDESVESEPDVTELDVAEPEQVEFEDVPTQPQEEMVRERTEDSRPAHPEESEPPAANWHAAMEQVSQRTVAEHHQLQESRNAAWKNSTRSVLIQRGEEIVALHDAPVVDDFQFAIKSRVFGIGLNIGRCFFGVPIAGVPVKDRTGDITLIVCARKR